MNITKESENMSSKIGKQTPVNKLKLVPQGEEVEEKVEIVQEEPAFEEQLQAAAKQSTEQFYTDVLTQADTRIKAQEEQIRQLQVQQLEFRDEIAMRLYIPFIDRATTHEQAATDAYTAADAFLRARETGLSE